MKLPQKARLTPIEPFRVERVVESKTMVVEMVAQLVEQGSEKGPELHHLGALRRPHPERDLDSTVLVRLVEAVELARLPGGAALLDADAHRRDAQSFHQPVDECLCRSFRGRSTAVRQRLLEV